ncbi:MAG: hypothetical protein ACLR0A_17120 [Faecalibacillus intestinalis]
MKITIDKDNYLKAIKEVVELEREAITRIKVDKNRYTTIESIYGPRTMKKIEKAEKRVYKEAKKIGISKENADYEMTKNVKNMRRRVREHAEKIVEMQ